MPLMPLMPWSGITDKPQVLTTRKITLPASGLSHQSSANITPAQWGLNLKNNAPAVGFVVPQPSDWDKTTPFTVTLYFALPGPSPSSTINWRLQAGGATINAPASEANNGWDSLDFWRTEDGTPLTFPAVTGGYFNLMKNQSWTAKYSTTYNTWYFGPVDSVTVANSFSRNPLWHFAFLRGTSATNGESYTGDLVVVTAELTYQAVR